jgi:NADH-quinone oxidoreductase subunit J
MIPALLLTAVALSLRNLIHTALLLVVSWFGLALFYLWAGAQFLAFAQVLIYVGAVSMVVLFAVLLTRRTRGEPAVAPDSRARATAGVFTGLLVASVLFAAVIHSSLPVASGAGPELTVHDLGLQLMGPHAAALLVLGVILTVALLGGVVIAATDRKEDGP